jgi:hypothetical protein
MGMRATWPAQEYPSDGRDSRKWYGGGRYDGGSHGACYKQWPNETFLDASVRSGREPFLLCLNLPCSCQFEMQATGVADVQRNMPGHQRPRQPRRLDRKEDARKSHLERADVF